jgi:hypothetical protein
MAASMIIQAKTNFCCVLGNRRVKFGLPLETLVTSSLLAFVNTDPRDSIFAVVPLASGCQDKNRIDPRLITDYQKPLLDVFTGFYDYCIGKSQSLDIICRPWVPLWDLMLRGIRDFDMPTWMLSITESPHRAPSGGPRLQRNRDSSVGLNRLNSQGTYSACAGLSAWWKFGLQD